MNPSLSLPLLFQGPAPGPILEHLFILFFLSQPAVGEKETVLLTGAYHWDAGCGSRVTTGASQGNVDCFSGVGNETPRPFCPLTFKENGW